MDAFTMPLQFQGTEPLYKQLYFFLTGEIKSGQLKEGEKLPSKKMAAAHLKVSQTTIETVYDMLLTEGYIRSVPRSGYYVCRYEKLPFLPPVPTPAAQEKPEPEYDYAFHTYDVETAAFPFSTWAKLTKEVVYQNPQLLRHGHHQGDLCLRQSLSRYLHEFRGVSASPDQIIIGAGMEYLMDLICLLLPANAKFALENPCYKKTYHLIRNHGREVLPIPVTSVGMDLAALAASGADVAYITPSHQFPMGVTMPVGNRLQLLKWANGAQSRFIIEDDYDSEFRYNGYPIPSLQGLDQNGKVIYIGTFSRSIAPSVRVAYAVLPPALVKLYAVQLKDYSCTVSRFEQHTLYRFIENGHLSRHLNRMRKRYKQRKEFLVTLLKSHFPAIQILGENAGLHFLIQPSNGMTEQELVRNAQKKGVKVSALSSYYFVGASKIPTIVLGYAGLSEVEITQAVDRLAQAWNTGKQENK